MKTLSQMFRIQCTQPDAQQPICKADNFLPVMALLQKRRANKYRHHYLSGNALPNIFPLYLFLQRFEAGVFSLLMHEQR